MTSQKQRTMPIQEELERRILHGLACEWENALETLNPPDKHRMRKPFFSLRDMRGKWGYWAGEKNEICLSRELVLDHPWDTICEILHHEMAHQYAEQALGGHDESPHGPKFKRACHLLRANPKASGSYKPLDERILQYSPSSKDKIMSRVKKLMALAQSQNQYEAESAMAKAHQLISKYNIDILARDEDRHFVSIFVGHPALRHFREDYHLAGLLQDFYFVYGIWVPAYVLNRGKMGSVLEISGTMQNVRIASYVHDFVTRFIDSQWQRYNKKKALNRYRKTDFAVGIVKGFRSKLKLQYTERSGNKGEPGLIKIEDPLLQEHVNYRYPYTASVRGKVLRGHKDVVRDGINIGKKLVISKGITEKRKSRKLLVDK